MMTMTIMDNKSSIIMIDNKISGRRCVRKMNNLDMTVSNHITKAASCFWSLSGLMNMYWLLCSHFFPFLSAA